MEPAARAPGARKMPVMTTHATTPNPRWSSIDAGIGHEGTAATDCAAGRGNGPSRPGVLIRMAPRTAWDWWFPGLFLCMVVAALPLMGLQWTYLESAAARQALEDSLMVSLPLFVPLPLLLTGCLVGLATERGTRTASSFAFLGAAVVVGSAGLGSVLAIL
ncbi:hypothetical protein [Variovorax sp. KK3]|uniref:hypothetical protein n=1 Tax=Variovorax sp. KK3 TaxID=1855728 RepID=UPI00117FAFCD|nr:hypothetical protein [Variovorax sp. KK3]